MNWPERPSVVIRQNVVSLTNDIDLSSAAQYFITIKIVAHVSLAKQFERHRTMSSSSTCAKGCSHKRSFDQLLFRSTSCFRRFCMRLNAIWTLCCDCYSNGNQLTIFLWHCTIFTSTDIV